MDVLEYNRSAWNRQCRAGNRWTQPVSPEVIARARQGDWEIVLTPKLPAPRTWFGAPARRRLLCLASGGGQQAPILAAAGFVVTSYDLSDEQLGRDHEVAQREGLSIHCVRGDMADLSAFRADSFDLIIHPCANTFAPDPRPVWRECRRVLAPGGELLAGFVNPDVFLFDHAEGDATGQLRVKHSLPYSDLTHLPQEILSARMEAGEPLEFSHSMDAQIGGQLEAGFAITGFYEDRWYDDSWVFARHAPVAFATRATRGC